MTRRNSTARSILGLVAVLMACSDEKPLTQIVVAVDSDWDGITRFELQVEGFKQPATVRATVGKGKDALPRRVVLVHDAGPLGPMSVTLRAYDAEHDDPVAIEPRTGIRFVEGKTLMLKIDVLLDCIRAAKCASGQACIAGASGPTCVSSSQAAKLVPWNGDIDKLATDYHVKDGDVIGGDAGLDGSAPANNSDANQDGAPGGGSGGTSGGGSGVGGHDHGDASVQPDASSGIIDAGPPKPIAKFDYTPANVDPTAKAITALDRVDVSLDCTNPSFDSSDLSFHNWCGDQPPAQVITQAGGGDAAVLVMDTLAIAAGSTLQLTGSRPVILLVFGDAQITGTIDAGGHASLSGPGADLDCVPGIGSAGAKASSGLGSFGAGGGSGGGFGSAGGKGGRSGVNSSAAAGGEVSGEATLQPLRGGCSGGAGGSADDGTTFAAAGGGGGALQIAAAGRLQIIGKVLVGGGGGGVGAAGEAGGGGGGSGGAVLLEGVPVEFDTNASVSANGGGGGGGQQVTSHTSAAGVDGAAGLAATPGGAASGSGGNGGDGASGTSSGHDGSDGSISVGNAIGASGGGGGGVGRIRINQATSCLPGGVFSPPPSLGCDSCGSCTSTASPPESNCTAATRGSALYYFCPTTTDAPTARDKCTSVGMHLVKVDDKAENDWLVSQISTETWIGANDMDTEGQWIWDADGSLFWQGKADGAAVGGSFVAWASDQPDDGPFGADCATVSTDASWSDHACYISFPYICE